MRPPRGSFSDTFKSSGVGFDANSPPQTMGYCKVILLALFLPLLGNGAPLPDLRSSSRQESQTCLIVVRFIGLTQFDTRASEIRLRNWAENKFGKNVPSKRYLQGSEIVTLVVSQRSLPKKRLPQSDKRCGVSHIRDLCAIYYKCCASVSSVSTFSSSGGRVPFSCTGSSSRGLTVTIKPPEMDVKFLAARSYAIRMEFPGVPQNSPHINLNTLRAWIGQFRGGPGPRAHLRWEHANGLIFATFGPPTLSYDAARSWKRDLDDKMYNGYRCRVRIVHQQ